ncbi:hypothetical protein A3D78_05725 [Candidatus Gottesmanbacteria bacterium RIFCSPHIGHO2_02_FULL_39_14]|uniref:Uncharacterized protein n=2 Tax=Candidatus Gottesmaniibacteriota TaxID=1752720 RepID=A0A1F6A3R4_9BACT|nr:MAG: hypothetical protein A2153_01070 [Candidatus Gottesmanbacteria bacterium RBG_16_38_7b]OGG18927.1 MAG: hypothetical protein A3D78_05725 [Candidatus Gottesmanbacteria bacterium RIFCSPHIGHO2_02_FULL_39_14]
METQVTSDSYVIERGKDILALKARSFINQGYPLSAKGKNLRQSVKQAVEEKNISALVDLEVSLPTIENPHLDLFAELKLSPDEVPSLLGPDLADVQVTKGCSHNCNYCSLAASHKVEVMPFAGVLKIAETKKAYETEVLKEWASWVQMVKNQKGLDIDPPLRKDGGVIYIPAVMLKDIPSDIGEMFSTHPLSRLLRQDLFFDRAPIGPFIPLYGRTPFVGDVGKKGYLTNYYDSDSFDYVSTSMIHEDGTPADYGDVCRALASEIRPIHITTAGWVRGNKIAERAAKKIVELYKQNPAYFYHPRISVNKSERRAERNLDEYLEDMKATILALKEMIPEVLLISDPGNQSDDEFKNKVINPLKEWLKKEGQPAWTKEGLGKVSHFSGRAAENHKEENDEDNANCMPGYHIWPNGEIANQKYILEPFQSLHQVIKFVPKGGRPVQIGKNIFK